MVPRVLVLQIGVLVALLALAATTGAPGTTVLPGCQATCGNVSIPYPFGIGPGCFREGFNVSCNDSFTPSKPFLVSRNSNTLQLMDVSLLQGQARVLKPVLKSCYDGQNDPDGFDLIYLGDSPFTINSTLNKFTAVGCDTLGLIDNARGMQGFNGGCYSSCFSLKSVMNGTCYGSGCCQIPIPKGVDYYRIRLKSRFNGSIVMSFNPCTYAFLSQDGWFEFDASDLDSNFDERNKDGFPVVLDWGMGNKSCQEARPNRTDYACVSENSMCNAIDGVGYRCSCSSGFEGNPYLLNGCQDIDECAQPYRYQCNGTCTNRPGSYTCSCPPSTFSPNPFIYPCIPIKGGPLKLSQVVLIGVGSGLGLLALLICGGLSYKRIRKRRVRKLREQFFLQNRGLLLQQLITSNQDIAERTKIFTLEELEKATNNFDTTRILGRGGHGIVYKGMLADQRVVAIKKSTVTVQSEIDQFINEVVLLSQINHRNVVKLFGCCLETEVPLLVYEFVNNGTLFHHLHSPDRDSSLSWDDRLRIATETTSALAYLHSSASIAIIHRDVKSSNILLDDGFTAKVSDFGISKSIPIDQTRLTTVVQGTFGYLDPEYFYTSQLTEKSDVYSLGVILIELLTGEKPISNNRSGEDKNLLSYFLWSMKENRLFEVLDARNAEEGSEEELGAVARLAEMCVRLKGEERPKMKEVEETLGRLRRFKKLHGVAKNYEETVSLLADLPSITGSENTSTGQYSFQSQPMPCQDIPR